MTKFAFEFGDGSVAIMRHVIESDDINKAFELAKERTNVNNPGLEFMSAYEMMQIGVKKKSAKKTEDGE